MSAITPSTPNRSLAPLLLFAATLFSSACLMFVMQPMFGKILLPLLGGSPAVWNTCMVFYQSILFLGYCYAHLLATRFSNLRQLQIHVALILLSLLALPLALPAGTTPPVDSDPTFWIVWTLLIAIGLPFFVVSTTAPLLQKWFAHIGHQASDDPYFLYAASNAGSLLALLSYPFLIEPNIGVSSQKLLWSGGYGLLALAIVGCGFMLWRVGSPTQTEITSEIEGNTLSNKTKLHWLALAFVPSSLLLGLTNFISTDIASVPLLWIIPLTLYLLSFILVFSKWQAAIHPWMLKLQPVVLLPFIAFSFINPAAIPYWLDLSLHLLSFFLVVMVCHGELAKHRPTTQHLTTFYLIMSFAGMLGGMFNTFVAPFIFNAVYEYPLMIIAALLLRPGFPRNKSALFKQALLPAVLFVLGIGCFAFADVLMPYLDSIGVVLILLVGLSYSYRRQAVSLALLTGLVILFTLGLHHLMSNTLHQERSFFGVLATRETVIEDEQGQPETVRELFHGTTKHGAQRLSENLQTTPLTYYSRPGPMGQLFDAYNAQDNNWVIGSVGLGAGALACYAKPTQAWTFYEIDPLVVKTASDPNYFTYLSRCTPKATMQIGDARLSIAKEPDQKFDLLIMDAFSSDAVPTHLLTQEALQLYFAKLKPNGLLAFHITNRHLALKNILADHARELHFAGLIQEFNPPNPAPLVVATDWVVMSKTAQNLQPLTQNHAGAWQQLPLTFNLKPWTDDFTNIISIWK
ncbi:MAG: fused MFS/spermidine synthase [Methylococcaceae bacterium]|nr:fused MFS/spermidine synthase [Methylococcaceae bacterium]